MTRITNARTKLLDKMEVTAAAPLSEYLLALNAMVDFGTAFKRGYGTSKKDSALIDLARTLNGMKENPSLKLVKWHCSLREIVVLVELHQHIAEGEIHHALALLD